MRIKKIRFLAFTLLLAFTLFPPTKVATAQLKATFEGHTDNVWSVAFRPNGVMLASASWDKTVRLWNVNTGRPLRTLTGHTSDVMSVVFSPDGQTLASASWDGTIRLWNPNNGKLKRTLTGHAGGVASVAFSPDGQTLVSGNADRTVRLWNVKTWKLEKTLEGHTDVVEVVAFSPDGATLASGSRDQTVRLWNPQNGQVKKTLTGYTDGVNPVAFSPDGATLLVGGRGISVWDTQTGKSQKPFAGDIGGVISVVFSPDGQSVASGSADNKVRLWGFTAADYEIPAITTNGMIRLVYFLPNDRPARPERVSALRQLIKDAQEFYAEQMEHHGYGRKTFRVETDKDGEPVVHQIHGKFEENYYHHGNPDPPDYKVWEELFEHFNDLEHIYFIAIDISQDTLDTACGLGGATFIPSGKGKPVFVFDSVAVRHRGETPGEQILGGSVIIPASGPCFYENLGDRHPLGVTTHELGHAFGIEHDFREGISYSGTVMGGKGYRLSECAAEWLSVSRFFNNTPRPNNAPGDIQLISKPTYSPEGIKLHFEVADADGLHQVQLLVPENVEGGSWGAYRLYDYKHLNGRTSTVEFTSVTLTVDPVDRIMVQIIDKGGSITWTTFLTDIAALLPPPKVVSIPDPNLAAAIREALGLDKNARITDRQIWTLTQLDAKNSSIKNLSGLEHAMRLQFLELRKNEITDIRPLTHLKRLEILILDVNNVRDISPLANMTQLTLLYIAANPISDFTPLMNLTELRRLALWDNNISDVTLIGDKIHLTHLHLRNNNIRNIAPLANLTQLQTLYLQGNQIRDVSPLVNLKKLQELSLSGNPITDKSPLHTLTERNPNLKLDIEIPPVENVQVTEPTKVVEDINGDGVVNIQDLVLVASNFGQTVENVADVNGDGVVNITDLVKVAGALGNAAAAPSLHLQLLETLTAADVRHWLTQAQHLNLTDATSQRGILRLEQLLAALIPKETSLLPNYPNPFNPETWIPYQLATLSVVKITIYNVRGTIVRQLDLGHQQEGYYTSRSRTAYWDGRNAVGEPVASGLYFYTLTAGDFTATRKMLIRK